MLLLKLDEKIHKPLYQQIREKVEKRVLLPGEILPSTRRLANSLSIHRSTVANTYQKLWAWIR